MRAAYIHIKQRHFLLSLIVLELLFIIFLSFTGTSISPKKKAVPQHGNSSSPNVTQMTSWLKNHSVLSQKVFAQSTGGTANTTQPGLTGANGTVPPLTLVLRPKDEDSYVINIATAQAIGGTTGGGSTGTTSDPVNPDATCPGTGPITCGTLSQGCHCSDSYNTNVCGEGNTCSWCIAGQDSSKYAIDITNPLDGPAYVPKVSIGGQAHSVTCKGYADIPGEAEPSQSIKVLSCADDTTGESVWMQFHHSKLSDAAVTGRSFRTGDVVAHSAPFEKLSSGPHVHFQIGIGGPCGSDMTGCRNANEFVQCN